MFAAYPSEYPFNTNNEGWPEHTYAPPYPHQYYYDNGQNPDEIEPSKNQATQYSSEFDNGYLYQPISNNLRPLVIRRHTPGSTDPALPQLSSPAPASVHSAFKKNVSYPNRSTLQSRGSSGLNLEQFLSPTPSNARVTIKRNPSQPNRHPTSAQNHSSVSPDPDERPIKPMKDTSVYNKPPGAKKMTQPKKPISKPKPVQSSPRYEPKSVQSSPRYEPEPVQPPPSRIRTDYVPARRPIRTDLIPRTPFGIPSRRHRPVPAIVEEYDDDYDGDDHGYPVRYVTPAPKKVVAYREAHGMTTREMENYQMSKSRRIARARPPIKTIIYRT